MTEVPKLKPCKVCGDVPCFIELNAKVIFCMWMCKCDSALRSHGPTVMEAVKDWNEKQEEQ